MTPKEKAKELVDKIYEELPDHYDDRGQAKRCALIAVDECLHTCVESMIYYWEEVKHEIELL